MLSAAEIVAVLRRAEKCRAEVCARLRRWFPGMERELINDCLERAEEILYYKLRLGKIEPPKNLPGWLVQTTHGELRNERRGAEKFLALELGAVQETAVRLKPEDIMSAYDKSILFSSLQPDYREVLELEDAGFKPKEIANEFDLSMAAIYKRLERAHLAFETVAARNGYPPPRFLPSHNNK